MAYLDTTRTSKLYADFETNYRYRIYNPTAVTPEEQTWDSYNADWTFKGHCGFEAHCYYYIVTTQPGGPGTVWNTTLYLRVDSKNGHGTQNTVDIQLDSQTNIPGTTSYVEFAGAIDGYHEGTVGSDVLWDITEAADPTLVLENIKWPRYTTYKWYERTTVGSTALMKTVVTGKATAQVSGTVATNTRYTPDYTAVLLADGNCSGTTQHYLRLTNVKVNNKAVPNVVHSNSIGNCSATEWAYEIKGRYNGTVAEGSTADLSTYISLARKCNVHGVVKSWKDPYTDKYEVDINGFNKNTTGYMRVGGTSGSFGGSQVLYYYQITTILVDALDGSNTVTTNLDEIPQYIDCNAVLATFDGGDLFTAADALFVRFRGWRFNGLTVKQVTETAVTINANDVNYTPHLNFSGYRFLHFDVKRTASGAQNFTIEITEQPGGTIKTWNLTTDSIVLEDKVIDLCSPHNITVQTDNQDDPYPRLNLTDNVDAASECKNLHYYGVSRVSRIRVSANSANVELGNGKLKIDYKSQYNFMPSGYWHKKKYKTDSVVSEVGTTTKYYARRFWHHDCDGRNEEEPDVTWQITEGGETGVKSLTISGVTIKGLADAISATDNYPGIGNVLRHTGWTGTNSVAQGTGCNVSQPALNPCYLNGETGLATWVNGGGYLAIPDATQGEGTKFQSGIDIQNDATLGKTITAQTIFNRINGDFIPDIDDPFDVVAVNSPAVKEGLYLRAVTVIRGCAHGLLLEPNGDIYNTNNQEVTLELAANNSNRGTANAPAPDPGTFETGTPWAKGDRDHNLKFGTLTIGMLPIHWAKKHKGVFKQKEDLGEKVSADDHMAGNQVYGEIKNAKANLWFSRAYNQTNWEEKNTTFSASDIEVKWKANTELITLIMVILNNAGNIVRYETTDFGGTWSVATTISTSGKNPSLCVSPHGMEYYFWYDNGAIKRLKRDYAGTTITAASNIVASGAADDDIACYWRDGVVAVFYRNTTGQLIVVTSTDNGETFA